jgi:hypothetical protein
VIPYTSPTGVTAWPRRAAEQAIDDLEHELDLPPARRTDDGAVISVFWNIGGPIPRQDWARRRALLRRVCLEKGQDAVVVAVDPRVPGGACKAAHCAVAAVARALRHRDPQFAP